MRHPFIVALLGASLSPVCLAQSATDTWNTSCANCHAESGAGGGAGTSSLLTKELSDPVKGVETDRRFFAAIKNGLPESGMPGFAETMNDARVWALVVHIRELQNQARRERRERPTPKQGVYESTYSKYRVADVVASGLEVPWAVDFIPAGAPKSGPPAGAVVITERPGKVRLLIEGTLSEPLTGTPTVRNRGQGGLMDVAIHPDFNTSGWVYLAYSDAATEVARSPGFTKIVRGHITRKDAGWAWTDQQTIFEASKDHYLPTDIHFGCRIVFTPKDASGRRYVFFGIGERGHGDRAPRLDRPNGKVYRLFDDGTVPADNPFVNVKDAYPAIWSLGHRNPQGLVFDLEGRLWDTEHGPRGGDELNLIAKGRNYGWPAVSFGINYNDAPFATPWPAKEVSPTSDDTDGVCLPAFRWLPSIGACGLDVARGDAFPAWKGDLLAGGLSGANVDRIRTRDGVVIEHERLIEGLGRVRDVVTGPGGHVYIVLNGPDKVIRLEPVP